MAVIAKAEITISKIASVEKITRYYLLQSSTAAVPSKPADGTAISSNWSKTEPSYTSGSTNTLYFVDQTILSDGAIKYSEVSKSSSYEAAKEAWNKANNAQNTADSAKSTADTARQEASDAAKTATNFMGFDSNGLVVGDRTANTLGKNVLIGNDSVNIRNGSTVLAEFAEKLIAIGKESPDAVIDFLNGLFKISADGNGGAYLEAAKLLTLGVGKDSNYSNVDVGAEATRLYTNNAGYVSTINDSTTSRVIAEAYGQNNENTKFEMFTDRSGTHHEIDMDTGNGVYTRWKCNGGGTADINHYVKSTDGSTQIAQWSSCIRMLKNDKLVASYDGTTPVLLSTAVYPKADITRTLSKPVSQQPHGIVLVFAPYVNKAPVNYGLAAFFVPKSMNTGTSVCFVMAGSTFDSPCCKWIYIHDDKIVGNDVNAQSGTKNGVKYNNAAYVLTKVYGV